MMRPKIIFVLVRRLVKCSVLPDLVKFRQFGLKIDSLEILEGVI